MRLLISALKSPFTLTWCPRYGHVSTVPIRFPLILHSISYRSDRSFVFSRFILIPFVSLTMANSSAISWSSSKDALISTTSSANLSLLRCFYSAIHSSLHGAVKIILEYMNWILLKYTDGAKSYKHTSKKLFYACSYTFLQILTRYYMIDDECMDIFSPSLCVLKQWSNILIMKLDPVSYTHLTLPTIYSV